MNVTELLGQIAEMIHDPAMERVDADRLISFLNSASRDAANEGWYVHRVEDTVTLDSTEYDYVVPDGFVYINELWLENPASSDVFDRFVMFHMWDIYPSATGPVIRFNPSYFVLEAGVAVRVVGQGRPSIYSVVDGGVDLDLNMESFLRERSISYAARFLAGAGNDMDKMYDRLSDKAYAISENLLRSHPQTMRLKPNARVVPGR